MRISKLIRVSVLTVLLGWLMSMTMVQAAAPQNNPVALLQYIANNMIAQLKEHKATLKNNREFVYRLARNYVVPYADKDEMAKRVLPPRVWESATPAQKEKFKSQFTTLLIRTYASALTAYEDQTIQFYGVRGGYEGRNTVEVRSEITSSQSQPIQVSYRLVNVGGAWRLYDMSVEGVDMLESFRAQFADILAQGGGIDQLLQRLSSHNNR